MTAATSRLRRRGIGAGVAALVGLTGLGVAAVPAQAAAGFDPSAASARVAGANRYATAAATATTAWPTGASTVIVANGEITGIDALAASYLAGVKDAPVLLTARDSVPAETAAAITTLNPTTVIVLGDVASVSASTYTSLVGTKTGQRIAGANRFATAVQVMTQAGVTPPKTVFLARGDQYVAGQVAADALAAGPAAYKNKIPILLSNSDSLPAETLAAMTSAGVTTVYVLGDDKAISASVYAQVDALAGTTLTRISGADRTSTASAIANTVAFGFSKTAVGIANGYRIDALAAGPAGGKGNYPILLTEGTGGIGAGTDAYLKANAGTLTTAKVFGDATSVPTALTDTAKASGGGTVATTQTLAITPTEGTALTIADETTTTATSDDRVYTVTGLNNALTYRVTLVLASNITNGTGGATFTADGASGLAAAGALAADITVVNGVPTGADTSAGAVAATTAPTDIQSVGAIAPSNGTISFRVDGQADETVTPVVYVDGGANTRLEISSTGVPTEAFGVGGTINFQPTEAVSGSGTPGAITEVDKANSQLVAGSTLYKYDANDNFFIGAAGTESNRVTQEAFLAELSVGDALLAGVYQRSPSLQSTFALNDLTPIAVASPTVTATPTGGVVTVPTASFTAGATLKVFVGPNNDGAFDAATDTLRATATTDADTTLTGFQIPVTGLTESTGYDLYVTQTVAGEESVASARVDLLTTSSTIATAPVSIATTHNDNDSNGLLNTGDSIAVTFNEAVTAASGATVTVTDDDGTVGVLTNGSGSTFTVGGTNSNVLTITLSANPGGGSSAGTAAGVNLLGANDNITAASGVTDRGTSPLAWAPSSTLGVRAIPGSVVVAPATLAAPTGDATADTVSGTAAVPFSSISVAVTGVGGAGTYTTTASSTGTYSVAVTGLAAGNTAIATQTVSGVGTSANSPAGTAA